MEHTEKELLENLSSGEEKTLLSLLDKKKLKINKI